MRSNLIKAVKITFVFCIFFALTYVFVLWVFAKLVSPNGGNAEVITLNGKVVGAENVGQNFTDINYFWGRPSAVNYTADASGGSNKGVGDSLYLCQVQDRRDTFLLYHPYLRASDIPAEMLTASGSGLDPDITPQSAFIQVKRVAQARGIQDEVLQKIVEEQIERPLLSLFGTAKVNVLKLNVAVEKALEK